MFLINRLLVFGNALLSINGLLSSCGGDAPTLSCYQNKFRPPHLSSTITSVRNGYAATLPNDGTILITGGYNGGWYDNSSEFSY